MSVDDQLSAVCWGPSLRLATGGVHRFFSEVLLWEKLMSTLSAFLDERLRVDGATRLDDINAPPWWEDGVTVAVDEATYMEYLEMLPPRYIQARKK